MGNYVENVFTVNASSYDLYTSKCNNLNILRYDVLFILRLLFIDKRHFDDFTTQLFIT
jgi:hypothetical protein